MITRIFHKLLAYLCASPTGVREAFLKLWHHVRPSPADVARTDELLDGAGGREVRSDVQDELVALLTDWRYFADCQPVGSLVDTDTALPVIARAKAGA